MGRKRYCGLRTGVAADVLHRYAVERSGSQSISALAGATGQGTVGRRGPTG